MPTLNNCCSICGSSDTQVLTPRLKLHYRSCSKCRHCEQVLEDQNSSAAFCDAQKRYYGDAAQFPSGEFNSFDREVLSCRASTLKTHLQKHSSFLEVGPGGGHILGWLYEEGHSVTAIEHSAALAESLSSRLPVTIRVGEFEAFDIENDSFDAVGSFHVIEHVVDPLSHLSKAYAVVKPGGFAFVATPNARSWQQIIFPTFSPNFDSAHLCVFSPNSLRILCEKAGWTVLKSSTPEFSLGWLRVVSKLVRKLRKEDEEETAGKYYQATSFYVNFLVGAITIASAPLRYLQKLLGFGNEVFLVLQKPMGK